VIDRTFSFEQAKDAFSRMASGAYFGKVAIASEYSPRPRNLLGLPPEET
jgi:hypothetical protein